MTYRVIIRCLMGIIIYSSCIYDVCTQISISPRLRTVSLILSSSRRSLRRFFGLIAPIPDRLASQFRLVAQDVESALVLRHHGLDLRDVLETQLLQLLHVLSSLIKQEQVLLDVHAGLDFVLQDKLAHHFLDKLLLETKEARQVLERERSVLLSGPENETLHGCRLECVVQSGLKEPVLELGHPCDSVDAVDVLERVLPIGLV